MIRIKKQKPRTLGKFVSLLTGCAVATAVSLYQPTVLTATQHRDLVVSKKNQSSPTENSNDISGMFGFSFSPTNTSRSCNHSIGHLTGAVTRGNNTLFIIEGATDVRLYHPDDRIDGMYPISAYDATHIIMRKSGSNVLLCLERHKDTTQPLNTENVTAFRQKNIITPYFSLIPVSGPEHTTIGYAITHCNTRCKIALRAAGLHSDDVLVAINNKQMDSEVWQQLRKSVKNGNTIVITVKRAGNAGTIDIPITPEEKLRLFFTTETNDSDH